MRSRNVVTGCAAGNIGRIGRVTRRWCGHFYELSPSMLRRWPLFTPIVRLWIRSTGLSANSGFTFHFRACSSSLGSSQNRLRMNFSWLAGEERLDRVGRAL